MKRLVEQNYHSMYLSIKNFKLMPQGLPLMGRPQEFENLKLDGIYQVSCEVVEKC